MNQLMINCGLDYSEEMGRWLAKDDNGKYTAPQITDVNSNSGFDNFFNNIISTAMEMEYAKMQAQAQMGNTIVSLGKKVISFLKNIFISKEVEVDINNDSDIDALFSSDSVRQKVNDWKNIDKKNKKEFEEEEERKYNEAKEKGEKYEKKEYKTISRCDEYTREVLISAGKLPEGWLDPLTTTVAQYKEYYKSQLKQSGNLGWNVLIMDGNNPNGGGALAPHMVPVYVDEDGMYHFNHYTSGDIKNSVRVYTLDQIKNNFYYSNFNFIPMN